MRWGSSFLGHLFFLFCVGWLQTYLLYCVYNRDFLLVVIISSKHYISALKQKLNFSFRIRLEHSGDVCILAHCHKLIDFPFAKLLLPAAHSVYISNLNSTSVAHTAPVQENLGSILTQTQMALFDLSFSFFQTTDWNMISLICNIVMSSWKKYYLYNKRACPQTMFKILRLQRQHCQMK